MFTGWDRPSHWLVLAVVVVVLFGYKKLPEAARSVGRSLRIFKTEMKGLTEDDAAREAAKTNPAGPVAPAADSNPANLIKSAPTQPTAAAQPVQPVPSAQLHQPTPPATSGDNPAISPAATTGTTTPGTV